MKLYHIKFDQQSYFVEAISLGDAVEAWTNHVRNVEDFGYESSDEPESIDLVHDEPVIRDAVDISALVELRAFVGVMFGIGTDAMMPETVTSPIGIPIKLGEIARKADAIIASAGVVGNPDPKPKLPHKYGSASVHTCERCGAPTSDGNDCPKYFCDQCPHASDMHNPDGSCPCGINCAVLRKAKP